MFAESTRYYDRIYERKDYAGEAARLKELIAEHKRAPGNRLLELACGTGVHLSLLRDGFDCVGGDLAPEMLRIAEERNPGVEFLELDIADFDIGREFDVITCLFSSIGYVGTVERLRSSIAAMARHLAPGGVVFLEPWFRRDQYREDTAHMMAIDEPDLKLCRMNVSRVDGNLSILDMHHLVATPEEGTRHFVEHHELAMFEVADFAEASEAAGLGHVHLDRGLMDRGLHILTKSAGS